MNGKTAIAVRSCEHESGPQGRLVAARESLGWTGLHGHNRGR